MFKKTHKVARDSPHGDSFSRRENIEIINFNPLTKSSNITQVMKQLDNYVQENFTTLSNCITTFKLPKINPPISPIFSSTITNSTTTSNIPAKGKNPVQTTKQEEESSSEDEEEEHEDEEEEEEEEEEEDEDEDEEVAPIKEINNNPLQDPNVPDAVKLAVHNPLPTIHYQTTRESR
jgi:hypothetical protein